MVLLFLLLVVTCVIANVVFLYQYPDVDVLPWLVVVAAVSITTLIGCATFQ